jgi:hypothetical protein
VVGLSLLAYASMHLKYWDEALLAGIYLINRLPTKVLEFSFPPPPPGAFVFGKNPIIVGCGLLGVPAGQT